MHHTHQLQEPTCTALVYSVWCLSRQIKAFLSWDDGSVPQGNQEQLWPPPSASSMASPPPRQQELDPALLPGATHPQSSCGTSQSHIHHYLSSQDPLSKPFTHSARFHHCSAQGPLVQLLSTTLSRKRAQDSHAPLKTHSGSTLNKGKKTPNLTKETHLKTPPQISTVIVLKQSRLDRTQC